MSARTKSKVTPKYKTKYRVKNWAVYEESLRRRGDITVWFDEDAIDAWSAPPSSCLRGQRRYSDLAIVTVLTLRTTAKNNEPQNRGQGQVSNERHWLQEHGRRQEKPNITEEKPIITEPWAYLTTAARLGGGGIRLLSAVELNMRADPGAQHEGGPRAPQVEVSSSLAREADELAVRSLSGSSSSTSSTVWLGQGPWASGAGTTSLGIFRWSRIFCTTSRFEMNAKMTMGVAQLIQRSGSMPSGCSMVATSFSLDSTPSTIVQQPKTEAPGLAQKR